MHHKFHRIAVITACLIFPLLSCSKSSSKVAPEKEKEPSIPKADKFTVTGRLIKNGGSPAAYVDITLVKANKQGDNLSFTLSTDENGMILNSEGKSDSQGKFRMDVNPQLVKPGQEYMIVANYPIDAALGNEKSVLLFKLEGEPREINHGDLSVLGSKELRALGVKNLKMLLPKPN